MLPGRPSRDERRALISVAAPDGPQAKTEEERPGSQPGDEADPIAERSGRGQQGERTADGKPDAPIGKKGSPKYGVDIFIAAQRSLNGGSDSIGKLEEDCI